MMKLQSIGQPSASLTYVDHPEIGETFVDFIEKIWVDGPVARIEFIVKRLDPPSPGSSQTGEKHTACRLVLPISALPILAGQLNGFLQGLLQQRSMKQAVTPPVQYPPTQKPN